MAVTVSVDVVWIVEVVGVPSSVMLTLGLDLGLPVHSPQAVLVSFFQDPVRLPE